MAYTSRPPERRTTSTHLIAPESVALTSMAPTGFHSSVRRSHALGYPGSSRVFCASGLAALAFYVFLDLLGVVPDSLYSCLQARSCHAELLRAVAQLVVLVHVNPSTVLPAWVLLVVGMAVSGWLRKYVRRGN